MIKLGIIFGGRSEEHEVSRMSATSVMGAVDTSKYEIIPIGITKDGRWYLYDGPVEKIVTGEWEDYAVRALAEDPENYSFSVLGAGGRSLKDIIDFCAPCRTRYILRGRKASGTSRDGGYPLRRLRSHRFGSCNG